MWIYKSGRNYMPCHDKYVGWGEPIRNFENKYIVGYVEDDHMCVVHIVNSVFGAIRLVNYLNGGSGTIPNQVEDLLGVQYVMVESLLSWIEKGKVSQTSGDYAKGWNDSIDVILEHMEKLLSQEENIAKLNR